MCLSVRSVPTHTGTLFIVCRSTQRFRISICDGVQQSELFPLTPCGLVIHGSSRQVTQRTATALCVATFSLLDRCVLACTTTDDVLSFPGPPHLSERALRRFLFSVLSVSFSFVCVGLHVTRTRCRQGHLSLSLSSFASVVKPPSKDPRWPSRRCQASRLLFALAAAGSTEGPEVMMLKEELQRARWSAQDRRVH